MVLVGLIAIVVLVTSNSSETIVGRWEKISDSLSTDGEILVDSDGVSRSDMVSSLIIYEDGKLTTNGCLGTAEAAGDGRGGSPSTAHWAA